MVRVWARWVGLMPFFKIQASVSFFGFFKFFDGLFASCLRGWEKPAFAISKKLAGVLHPRGSFCGGILMMAASTFWARPKKIFY